MVSILTRPEGRVLPVLAALRANHFLVSILTRPEGRVLQGRSREEQEIILFQSSPDPKAGCYHLRG